MINNLKFSCYIDVYLSYDQVVDRSCRKVERVLLCGSIRQSKINVHSVFRSEENTSSIEAHGVMSLCKYLVVLTLAVICSDWRVMTYLLAYISVFSSHKFESFSQQGVKGFLHSTDDATEPCACVGSNQSQSS